VNYPYPIPYSQSNAAAFVADSTGMLGSYTKPLDAQSLITVDYTQLVPPVTLQGYSFRVSPGGEPQLRIGSSALVSNMLSFVVQGGISGRSYTMTLDTSIIGGQVRSDVLVVNVPGDDCSSCQVVQSLTNNGLTSPDGSLYVNAAPRLFVSATPPNGANVMDHWYNSSPGNLYEYLGNNVWRLISAGPAGP
jgi:hypothetical protein